ncbi:MAG TPA: hypothetical protein VGP76_10375 [Planctomycetaceae bacterium]|jgi:hypothetical protein|nr:hypothetical protein [Planctomycetaceae bacterium]
MRDALMMRNWLGAPLILGAMSLAAGCHQTGYFWPTDRCADIPCGAIPQPAGVYSCQWQTEQKLRAEQDKFVIYQYEWFQGRDHLGPAGRRHIEAIAQRLDNVPYPVLIEKSEDTTLDETRRQFVIATLISLGAAQAERRVILGYSEAEGLDGTEAVRLGNRSPAAPGTTPGGGGYSATNAGFGAGTTFGGGFGGLGGGSGSGMGIY